MKGCDSYGAVTGVGCQAAGVGFACRYLWTCGSGQKGMGAAEYADLRAHGILVVLNYEGGTTDVASGYPGGQVAAKTANAYADSAGADTGAWIYFSIDESVPESAAVDYFKGLGSIPGRPVAAYGGDAAKGLMQAGLTVGWWQSESSSFSQIWPDPAAHIFQNSLSGTVGGTQVDWNVSQADYFGACGQGGFMALTDQQQTDLANQVAELHHAIFDPVDNSGPANLSGSGVPWAENTTLVLVRQIAAEVAKLAPGPGGPLVLSDADVARIAAAVWAKPLAPIA